MCVVEGATEIPWRPPPPQPWRCRKAPRWTGTSGSTVCPLPTFPSGSSSMTSLITRCGRNTPAPARPLAEFRSPLTYPAPSTTAPWRPTSPSTIPRKGLPCRTPPTFTSGTRDLVPPVGPQGLTHSISDRADGVWNLRGVWSGRKAHHPGLVPQGLNLAQASRRRGNPLPDPGRSGSRRASTSSR